MKFHWNSDVVADAIRAKGYKVVNTGPGGDHDTDELVLELENGDQVFISGYIIDDVMTNTSDADVEAITVSDGKCSSGGLTSNDPTTIQAYADVRIVIGGFLNGTETHVYNHHDELF